MSRYDRRDEIGYTPFSNGGSITTYADGVLLSTPGGPFPFTPDMIRNIVLYVSLVNLGFVMDMGLIQGPVLTPPEIWDLYERQNLACDTHSNFNLLYEPEENGWLIQCYPMVTGLESSLLVRLSQEHFELLLTDFGHYLDIHEAKFNRLDPWIIREINTSRDTALIVSRHTIDLQIFDTVIVMTTTKDDSEFWLDLFERMEHLFEACLVGTKKLVRRRDKDLQEISLLRTTEGVNVIVKEHLDGEVFAVGCATFSREEYEELEVIVRSYLGVQVTFEESDVEDEEGLDDSAELDSDDDEEDLLS